jgi:hypothetical protein
VKDKTPARPRHIPARGETADTLKTFADAFAHRRGILMVATFNEGEEVGKRTKQWTITSNDLSIDERCRWSAATSSRHTTTRTVQGRKANRIRRPANPLAIQLPELERSSSPCLKLTQALGR